MLWVRIDEDSVWNLEAGDLTDAMACVEQQLRASIDDADLSPMDLEPETARTMLKRR
jgi:hypothetical protein